jgi:DNA polymerase III subunit epsilon
MLRDGEGWRKGETWGSRVNPDGLIDPDAIKIHGIRPADLKHAARFPTILPRVKELVGESPIVAHAYKNERDFLDYEFARAKAIQWARAPTMRSDTFARRSCSHSFSLERVKSLTSVCDRLVLDTSERDDRHGALLDAEITADALTLMKRQLKHGESGAPRSWTST